MLEYKLIRSKRRKTLGLQVKHGQVTVRAPYYVSSDFIDTFIQQKSAWLLTKVTEQKDQINYCDFSHGSHLLFLGKNLTLKISVAKKSDVFISDSLENNVLVHKILNNGDEKSNFHQPDIKYLNIVISERVNGKLVGTLTRKKQVKKQLECYFKKQAELLISERMDLLSKQISLWPIKTNIRQFKARWGSCNNRGEVSFNYLLMMSPLFVIDYVIVHELCHLEYLNHSKDFWQLVETHCPYYQQAKDWLSNHQSELYWTNPT
jgi:predicted metal-dependent hydrolase